MPLSSAQKFGLVEAPEQLLSEADWQKAKEKSNQRDDSKLPCVICKEDFGFQEQARKNNDFSTTMTYFCKQKGH